MKDITKAVLERIYTHCVTEKEPSVRSGILVTELGVAKPTVLKRIYHLQENGLIEEVLQQGICAYRITDRGIKSFRGEYIPPLNAVQSTGIYDAPIKDISDLDGIVLSAVFNSDELASTANSEITVIAPPKGIALNGNELKMFIQTKAFEQGAKIMSYLGANLPSIQKLEIKYAAKPTQA